MPIYFYSTTGEHGCFSNFSRHGFTLDGVYWKTSEHYFQAQKFVGTEHVERIRLAKTPNQAALMGRDRKRPLRPDWESVKEAIMQAAVLAKFSQNEAIRAILLGTGDEALVENAPKDYYWGIGTNGTGKNRLGVILAAVRAILREQEGQTQTTEGTQ
ncbi:MAG TPA: NADAR family protein [Aggregatilineales bacterium]|nr:NADAR family protein [Anaerolineales bacterium]HRE47570.1 NADAR family protein [Aggregatilineales bacterium]